MRSLRWVTMAAVSLALGMQHAAAFSVDDSTTSGAGAARYADPEDQAEQRLGIATDGQPADPRPGEGAPSFQFHMNPDGADGSAVGLPPFTYGNSVQH